MKKMGYKILYALHIAMPVTTLRPLFAHLNQTKIKASFQVLSYLMIIASFTYLCCCCLLTSRCNLQSPPANPHPLWIPYNVLWMNHLTLQVAAGLGPVGPLCILKQPFLFLPCLRVILLVWATSLPHTAPRELLDSRLSPSPCRRFV